MTVKEANVRFGKDVKDIRKSHKDGMILGSHKVGRNIIIPDETTIIPAKKEIQNFLLQILKFKNNHFYVISRDLCPTPDHLKVLVEYLVKKGLIGSVNISDNITDNITELLESIQLTDKGFEFTFSAYYYDKINAICSVPLNINISGVHVG